MSFWDDFLPIAGSVAGGVAGSFFGQPMLGAGIGGALGKAGAGAFGGGDDDMNKARIAAWQKLYGELPTYQGPPPGQGLTATDIAAMEKARGKAGQFAQGREGALEQQDAATSGGTSRSGKLLAAQQGASQEAAGRLNEFDLGQAGIAAQRDAWNRQMLNDFNMRNMMNKINITQGLSGGYGAEQDYNERLQYSRSGNMDDMFSKISALGLTKFGKDKSPWDDPSNFNIVA